MTESPTTDRPEVTGVAGVAESAVSAAVLARLPATPAPAPWSVRCQAVVWFARGGAAATSALPPALRSGGSRGLVVVGGLVRYLDTPVGPYDEVFGLVQSRSGGLGSALRSVGTVCFMAVDSEASLLGGRTNWGMPKTLGRFTGAPADGAAFAAESADDMPWRVTATPRAFGPSLPVFSRALTRQEVAGARLATSRLRARGRVRLARVDVDVTSDGALATWLRPGRHLGAVVESAEFTLEAPRPEGSSQAGT